MPWSMSGINRGELLIFDGIMTAWSFTVGSCNRNFSTSLMDRTQLDIFNGGDQNGLINKQS